MPESTDFATEDFATEPFSPVFTGGLPVHPDPVQPLAADREPLPAAAHPEAVPGNHHHLKRWTFVLVVAGVWIVGAACGLGLYYWWFHSLNKTVPVFVVLIFLTVCAVGGLLTAMVDDKPLLSALGIGLMSAPLAATAAAAVLHGHYFCEWASRCFMGLIPY